MIIAAKNKITDFTLGMIAFEKDIDLDLDLAKTAFERITLYGKFVGPKEIKEHFNL